MRPAGLAVLVAGLLVPFSVAAQDAPAVLHSDWTLPLHKNQELSPSPLQTESGFGMGSRFALGDWKIVTPDCDDVKDPLCALWARLEILSPNDGGFLYAEANARGHLAGHGEPAAIIQLAPASAPNLYALQIGVATGSRYVIFTAESDPEKPIKNLTLLNPRCLKRRDVHVRISSVPGVYVGHYCAVNAMPALIAIAQDAMHRAPLGTMTWAGAAPDGDD